MGVVQRRGRLITIQELLENQRETVPARCPHCGRHDGDRDEVFAALRDQIRALEARVHELETKVGGVS